MVKVSGPMMSLGASGTLADTITFATWKGRPYVRERVIPSNPQSGAQTGRRSMFKFTTQNWTNLSAPKKATWQDLADQIVASPFNAFIRQNMENWHNFLAPSEEASALRSDVAGVSDNASDGTWEENRIKLETTLATLNQNWGLIIFASDTTSFTPAVGNVIQVQYLITTDPGVWYWTPSISDTYYFRNQPFSFEGKLGALEAEYSAVP